MRPPAKFLSSLFFRELMIVLFENTEMYDQIKSFNALLFSLFYADNFLLKFSNEYWP